ncbi:organoarsenical effux MFS transporter ArsJ [Chitinivibrio alkaliphilus]|uniref:Major facilitator superfamily protein n=1 Tax=Chitinivibrio alkaliphilus ACht1 TaxID=1313304 RepID=U7D8H7_9BACT|nr:organoarsenical effux MFS transporter ArsJ [Chitinivibrio alkaliphilus]ERP31382.1 major facilitator superfamily protein [Chitinivibrio alkaliphilus ACht1]
MNSIKSYAVVTGAYWSFMLTDGAIRMLILLYFHRLGYSPVTLAFLFLLYEFFGMLTNLFGGWFGQKYGLKAPLIWGLSIQPVALIGLSFLNHDWPAAVAIPFVMTMQSLSGIAKDLTKMSSKTAIKYLIPQQKNALLFKWVAVLTGSKNAVKGAGFFVGGFLLQYFGFSNALIILALLILVSLGGSLLFLPPRIGAPAQPKPFQGLFRQQKNIKILSAARVFLFAARDIWFVVAIPIYFSRTLGWTHSQVGTFMAVWVIIYGGVQAGAPALLGRKTKRAPGKTTTMTISCILTAVMGAITLLFHTVPHPEIIIIAGLFLFGAAFAVNSSVHSYLVLAFAHGDTAATNVGFYYMANAGGRLTGTFLSGILFQWGGVSAALAGSTVFLIITTAITGILPDSSKTDISQKMP